MKRRILSSLLLSLLLASTLLAVPAQRQPTPPESFLARLIRVVKNAFHPNDDIPTVPKPGP